MALLDDAERQSRVVAGVSKGETLAQIASELGTTRQTLSRYLARHPEFKRRVDTARARAAKLAHERTRAHNRESVEAELVDDLDLLGLPSPAALGRLLWATARNPHAKGQGRAQAILAELVYRPLVRAAEVELDAEPRESGVVFVEIPRNGSEAPGRGPRSPTSAAIGVEHKINGSIVVPPASQ